MMKTVVLNIVCLTVFSTAAFAGVPEPQNSSTCTVTLPAGVQGFSYVVSNLTGGVEIAAAELLDGGASYELPIGAKIAIYAVPEDGYVVRGANPAVIDEVTAGTTLEDSDLPKAVEFEMPRMRTLAPFLHEVWYDDYGFDSAGATLSKDEKSACSSARNGNFIGRNLDFFLNDTPEFVVHVAADPSKGRLASVGMAMHSGLREDGVTNGRYTVSYDLVPNRTLDGINEMGVAINQNVVAYDPEVAGGPGREFEGTNPAGEDLNISFVTRFVLDHATNAAHAVELIKSRNLVGMSVSGDLLHYMVSDRDETYVVEIITNSIVARPMRVMTNFCLNWDNGNARALTEDDTGWTMADYPAPWVLAADKGSMSDITNAIARYYAKHAEGVERFVRLRDNYAEGETFAGMADLLKRVMYSQAATTNTQPYWYSDRTSVAVDELLTEKGYPDAANIRMLYALKYMGNLKLDELLEENLMKDERTYLADKDRYRKDDTGVWFTVHNTTYDIAQRMFRVVVQEEYDDPFDIWLVARGSEANPWKVGGTDGTDDLVEAHTNGTELVIGGKGTVTNLAEIATEVKAGIKKLTITGATVSGATEDAFEEIGGEGAVEVSLPDNWQGNLPDENGELYGMKVDMEKFIYPKAVRNVKFQQRYPWNGLADVSCDLTGSGEVTLGVTVLTNGVTFIEAQALIGETTIDLDAAGGVTNGVKFIWNAAADLPAGFRAQNVKVKVLVEK